MTYDAVIVGAGVIGLSIAWRARRAGLSVLVLGSGSAPGASRVAAGMLAPVTEATFGEERLLELNLESARRYPLFLEDLSKESGYSLEPFTSGTLFAAIDRDQLEALRRLYDFQRSLDLEVEWLERSAARELEPMLHPSTHAAALARSDREIDPLEVVAALMSAIERAGGEVRPEAEVAALAGDGDTVTGVSLADGEQVAARAVVIAAGCWSGRIRGAPKEIQDAVRPVKGQILRLRPRASGEPIISHVIRTEDVYLVPRAGGEVVVGATVEEQGFDTSLTAGGVFELLRAAAEAVPGIREMELSRAGAGLRPGSRDNAPLIGPTRRPGLAAATGHFRNGVLLAPVTADSITALLLTGEVPDEILAFDPRRFA